jgi:hypothetical protein
MAETVSHSYVALDQHYITEEELELVNNAAKLTSGYMNYLKCASKNQ